MNILLRLLVAQLLLFFGTVKGLFYKFNGDLDSTILNITDGQFDLKY